MKFAFIIFAVFASQVFANFDDSTPQYATPLIISPELRDFLNLVVSTNALLENLPDKISENVGNVIDEGISMISNIMNDGPLGNSAHSASIILNNLKYYVETQMRVGVRVVQEEMESSIMNASIMLYDADVQINGVAHAAEAIIDNAINSSKSDAEVECLKKIIADMVKRTDSVNQEITICLLDKVKQVKNLLDNILKVIEDSNDPLKNIVSDIKTCLSKITDNMELMDEITVATCLGSNSADTASTETTLTYHVHSILSATFRGLDAVDAEVPGCVTQETLENVIAIDQIKSAVETCSQN